MMITLLTPFHFLEKPNARKYIVFPSEGFTTRSIASTGVRSPAVGLRIETGARLSNPNAVQVIAQARPNFDTPRYDC